MSFDTLSKTPGRQPVIILEMDLDYCPNTYGVAPCAAALGVTGAIKCFNTCATCQDTANYARTPIKTYRFSSLVLPIGGPTALPTLRAATITPARIDPGQGLGQRASVQFTVQDVPFSDLGVDKYVRERPYNSATRGTFWTKFLARNPYYQSRPCRMITGYLNADGSYDAANFETRLYFLDQIDGPDPTGAVTITCKDLLKLLDDDRTQAPAPSNGQLAADIDEITASATLQPVGIGDAEYPADGVAMIGSECVSFTRVADVLTMVRAQHGTKADSHKATDSVQICLVYDAQPVQDIVYDLMTTYGGIDPSFIDKSQWDDEVANWLPQQVLSGIVEKPTGVNALLTELTSQALFYIWWDERAQTIPFRAVRPARESEVTAIGTDNNLLLDQTVLTEDPSQRLSEVWVYYGRISLSESLDKASNWSKLYINDDVDAESDNQYGEQRVQTIYSRWLPTDDDLPAKLLGVRLIARYRNNPRTLTVQLDAKDHPLWTGDIARVTTRAVVDATGEPLATDMMVIGVTEEQAGTIYTYELGPTFFNGRYGFVAPPTPPQADYSLASDSEKRKYAFIAPNSNVFADGTLAYKVI